jgi:hypothetical protein
MQRRTLTQTALTAVVWSALSFYGSPPARAQQCDPTPLAACKQPIAAEKALLLIKANGGSGDKLVWKWAKGETTAIEDFGDPLGTTIYTLCIYDESAGTPTLALTAVVPAGGTCDGKPCWSVIGKGFKYKDPTAANDGIKGVLLKFGASGKAKIVVKGKGDNLDTPVLPLAQDPQVVVQLKNDAGVCWEARYSAPVTANDAGQFKDKGDAPLPTPTARRRRHRHDYRTATATNTPAGGSTPTFTATATPTPGGAMCGNGFLEPGETCGTCPADCVVSPCTPSATMPSFAVKFTGAPGVTATTVTVLLGYQSDLVSIPGTGNATSVRQRITYPPPLPNVQSPSDLDYALRLVVGRTAGLQNGLLATVKFDQCVGAPAAAPTDFGCTVEACAGSGGPIADCACTVTTP